MLHHTDRIVTARIHGKLVVVYRVITYVSFCTYLSDLAVDTAFQNRASAKS